MADVPKWLVGGPARICVVRGCPHVFRMREKHLEKNGRYEEGSTLSEANLSFFVPFLDIPVFVARVVGRGVRG